MDLFDRYRRRTEASLRRCIADGVLPPDLDFGRFAATPSPSGAAFDVVVDAALVYARDAAAPAGDPVALARAIALDLATDPCSASVDVAGPGFVNVTLRPAAVLDAVASLLRGSGAGGGRGAAASAELRPDLSLGEARALVTAEQIAALSIAAGRPARPDGRGPIVVGPVTLRREARPPERTTVGGPSALAGLGADAFRFAVASRRPATSLHLDAAAWSERSRGNPAFNVPYAHARLRGVLRAGAALAIEPSPPSDADLSALTHAEDLALARSVVRYPHAIAAAAAAQAPHRVAAYLGALADAIHCRWNRSKDQPQLRFVNEEERVLSIARLGLVTASTLVLKSGLGILGVTAPDEML
ncbi:hypothetical protein D3273_05330 [Lichenibacterium minor]|uniref:arginine--tRNA ligase n=1 Tax=Lichenibacterium minor TaxID=2316528 RepID=A0A4Q2U8R5_9HYPH|nr:DALR anticodon-binding domain-containing protein [Lichenibacterium minor]RYC32890.1 hypothetical protein D3273_05330 [Lichenibacterium minor]